MPLLDMLQVGISACVNYIVVKGSQAHMFCKVDLRN